MEYRIFFPHTGENTFSMTNATNAARYKGKSGGSTLLSLVPMMAMMSHALNVEKRSDDYVRVCVHEPFCLQHLGWACDGRLY